MQNLLISAVKRPWRATHKIIIIFFYWLAILHSFYSPKQTIQTKKVVLNRFNFTKILRRILHCEFKFDGQKILWEVAVFNRMQVSKVKTSFAGPWLISSSCGQKMCLKLV
jgi:hypothetical protein